VRARIAQQTESPEAIVEAATDAVERAERILRRKYAAMSRAILGEALIAHGQTEDGLEVLVAAVDGADELGTPSLRWQHRVVLGRARYATGDDDGAATAYREAAEVIRSFADSLAPEHAASFLGAEPVRETLAAAGWS
jgi:hypothetical protein